MPGQEADDQTAASPIAAVVAGLARECRSRLSASP